MRPRVAWISHLGFWGGHQNPPPLDEAVNDQSHTPSTSLSTWVTLGITTLRFNLHLLPHWRQERTGLLDMDVSAFLALALNESPQTVRKLIRLQWQVFCHEFL